MDPLTVTRSVTIDTAPDRVWRALATAEGLASWLGGDVDLDVAPGAAGWCTDDRRRRVVVGEVRPGARLSFTWWPEDDADAASSVVVQLAADGEGTTVTVTEMLDPVGALGGRASLLADSTVDHLGAEWAGRLGTLAGRLSPVPVWA